MSNSQKVHTVQRPYTLTFKATGTSYPISSEDAQRLIDEYPVVKASKYRVSLRGDDGYHGIITPATLGGGPAFEIER